VAAGSAAFMFRRRIARKLLAATLGPRTTEEIATVVPTTAEESEVKKEKMTETKHKGQRSRARSHEWREDNKQRSLARPHEKRQEDGIPMGLLRDWRILQGSW
jgi:hypothetical protein